MLGITWQLYAAPPPPPLLIAGGRLIQPQVAELAQRFSQQTGEEVQVEAGGSMAGMAAVKRGAIDIAMVGQPVPGCFLTRKPASTCWRAIAWRLSFIISRPCATSARRRFARC